MKRRYALPLLVTAAAAFGAEPFGGDAPIICMPLQGHDCLPTQQSCKTLQPEPGKDLNLRFDIQAMSVKTPYRNDTLPISTLTYNDRSLLMQGTSLQLLWSAAIHRKTGRLTIAVTDREGAYVIFGQCQPEDGHGRATNLQPDR